MEDNKKESELWDTQDFKDTLNYLREIDQNNILYCPVTDEMLPYVERYATEFFNVIADKLKSGGADEETVSAVLTDYAMTAAAGCSFTADREHMQEALRIISPFQAFMIDRFVLFDLLKNYECFIAFQDWYNEAVVDIRTATTETKLNFLQKNIDALQCRVYIQFIVEKTIDIELFTGIDRNVIDNCNKYRTLISAFTNYVNTVLYSRHAFHVPKHMMNGIQNSAAVPDKTLDKCLFVSLAARLELTEKYMKLVNAAENEDKEEIAQAKKEIQEQKAGTYAISQDLSDLNSRDVFAYYDSPAMKKNGLVIGEQSILPIMQFVDIVELDIPDIPISTATVQNALYGLSVLKNMNPTVTPVNGKLVYKTSLREFASMCYDGEVSNTDRLALLKSLLLIDKAGWLCVWKSDGMHAVRPVHIPDLNLSHSGFTVEVYAYSGHHNIVSATEYNNLRKEKRHEAKKKLYHQLISKHHKEQVNLINEIYSYDTYLANITDEDEKAKFLRQWQKNFPNKKKQVEQWLNEFKEQGVISWWILEPLTNEKGFMYRWKRHVEGEQELFADEDFKCEEPKGAERKTKKASNHKK